MLFMLFSCCCGICQKYDTHPDLVQLVEKGCTKLDTTGNFLPHKDRKNFVLAARHYNQALTELMAFEPHFEDQYHHQDSAIVRFEKAAGYLSQVFTNNINNKWLAARLYLCYYYAGDTLNAASIANHYSKLNLRR